MTIYKTMPISNAAESYDDTSIHIDEMDYEALGITKPKATRKTHNCPFLLLNVLFSNAFAERFGSLGDPVIVEK